MRDAPKDPRLIFDRLGRVEQEFPLFRAVYDVLTAAPSSRRYDEEEIISEAVDALDYLIADGRWQDRSDDGRTELRWDGRTLSVYEDDGGRWRFRNRYEVAGAGDVDGRASFAHGTPGGDAHG